VELGMPVVIHERDSWTDTLEILKEYTGRIRAVFHCFGKTPAHAAELLALGHSVSFTGIVTFKTALDAQASAKEIPDGTLFVETDSPFLSPIPHRGKTCEPAFVRHTAEFIAALRGISLEEFARQTEDAANRFFRFPK
jgi:TatD DNase family protein